MDLAMLLSRTDAVLSDLDGTLVDSSGPVRRAWAAFAARHGLDPETVFTFAQGRPSSETVRLLAPDADHARESRRHEQTEVEDTDGVVALPGAAELLGGTPRPASPPDGGPGRPSSRFAARTPILNSATLTRSSTTWMPSCAH